MWDRLQCEARVLEVKSEGNKKLVKLSVNPFRPALGGQDSDRGWLLKGGERVSVLDVKKVNGELYLVIPGKYKIEVGETVLASVDPDRRRKLSRLHTGEHILFKSMQLILGEIRFVRVFLTIKNGRPFGELTVITSSPLNWEVVKEIELLVNKVIWEARGVKTYIIPKNKLEPDVRVRDTILSRLEEIRVVEIEGFDKTACSGTHVENTREIGLLKITDWKLLNESVNEYKIEFTVHLDALDFSLSTTNMVIELSNLYAFQTHQINNFVINLINERKYLEGLKSLLLEILVKELTNRIKDGKPILIANEILPIRELTRTIKKILRKLQSKQESKQVPPIVLVSKINNVINVSFFGGSLENEILYTLGRSGFRCWGEPIKNCSSATFNDFSKIREMLMGVLGNETVKLLDSES